MRSLAVLASMLVMLVVSSFAPTEPDYTYEFALRLTPSGTSLISTAIVTVAGDEVVKAEVINEKQFMMEVSGMVHSKANPAPEDLFKQNGIAYCSQVIDTIKWKYKGADTIPYKDRKEKTGFIVEKGKSSCPLLQELWKIRYKRDIRNKNYNYLKNSVPDGWAADNYFPNLKQIDYLKANYSSDCINNYVYGEKLFKLLRDVQDTAWVNKYKKLQ